jgi:glycosyltransferase involved in cell wall biosynthesis
MTVRAPAAVRDADLDLIVYPLDLNPYQELLYDAIRAGGTRCDIRYVRKPARLGPLPFLVQVIAARIRGCRLIHMHWPQFVLRARGRTLYRLSLINAVASIHLLGILGIRIVWTVHNTLPHEPETADDAMITRLLARKSSHKIVHSAETVRELERLGADTERITVIPHGSYVGTYLESGRVEARRALALPEQGRVVLFFGQIRPYKGVDDLIEAWQRIARDAPRSDDAPFLLIAGKCDEPVERKRLERTTAALGGRFDAGYASGAEVPQYFAAADVVALPFRSVTTSGSALLAMSLARPVVAPRLGALRDLPVTTGFFYEPRRLDDALRAALTASSSELEMRGEAALAYARSVPWSAIAERTLAVYREALGETLSVRPAGERAGQPS